MLAFFTQVIKNYRTTGAVFPSSAALGRAMTKSARLHEGPKRVLEVGPGTGAFTKLILSALRPGDEFHVVEINPGFAEHLDEATLAPFRAAHPGVAVTLHVAPIECVEIEGSFDFIICGLPFNNFPLSTVSRIFRRMLSLLKEGGQLTYFEYLGMKAAKWPWVGSRGRDRLRRRMALERALERRYSGHRDVIFRNITPARAIHLSA